MASKYVYTLIPGACEYVTLFGKRDFADVIKVKDFETGRFFCIIWVGPI